MNNKVIGKLNSQNIVSLSTIGSWYANGCLCAYDDKGGEYRIHVHDLLASLSYAYPTFDIIEKRVHKYLVLSTEQTD